MKTTSERCIRSYLLLPFALLLFVSQPSDFAGAEEKSGALDLQSEEYFQEKQSGRMWRVDRSKKLKTPQDVAQYLDTVNEGTYNDWRLPTKQELYDLFAIFDLKRNGEVQIRLEGDYWLTEGPTSPVYVGSWQIGDGCGPSRSFYSGKKGYVRAVRP